VLLPFIREGFTAGDRAVHIVDPAKRERHLKALSAAGIDAERGQEMRQLEVRRWEDAYLREGTSTGCQAGIDSGRARGRASSEISNDATRRQQAWALQDRPGVGDIVEYESRLNYVLPQYDDTVVCTSDLAKFIASAVIAIVRAHPMVIVGDVMQENRSMRLRRCCYRNWRLADGRG
jgi:hypothetical protein